MGLIRIRFILSRIRKPALANYLPDGRLEAPLRAMRLTCTHHQFNIKINKTLWTYSRLILYGQLQAKQRQKLAEDLKKEMDQDRKQLKQVLVPLAGPALF